MEITKPQADKSLLHYKFTPAGGLIVVLLVLALIALGERVLYDLARWITSGGNADYFDNLQVIVMHAIFIIAFLIISIFVNMIVGEKKEKYALALIPYFILSIVLSMQLTLQVAVYFGNHHTNIQFYLVMAALSLVCTVAIYFIQKRFNPTNL